MKKHEITLSPEERQQLTTLTRQKTLPARKVERAKILLQADANGPHQSDTEIASALGIASTTVWRTKRLFAEQGLEASLEYARAVRFKPRKLDGRGEAKLIALACSAPPPGRAKWTLRLLADTLVELKVVEDISHEAVRRTLKKTSLPRTSKSNAIGVGAVMRPLAKVG
jgi:transposase